MARPPTNHAKDQLSLLQTRVPVALAKKIRRAALNLMMSQADYLRFLLRVAWKRIDRDATKGRS